MVLLAVSTFFVIPRAKAQASTQGDGIGTPIRLQSTSFCREARTRMRWQKDKAAL